MWVYHMWLNVIIKYFVRFSYPSILLLFVVIDCSVIGMLYSFIIISKKD